MSNSKGWILVIGILLILGIGMVALINVVQNITEQTLQPINDTTGAVGTQVSQVLNPTPTIVPDPITIIHDIRSISRLETVQYSMEKVITAETGQEVFGSLFGDRLLFVAHGIVIAGVDMEKLGPKEIWLDDGVLFVNMPDPEIFLATLDNDKSYVYDRNTGLLTKGNVNLETTARRIAEDEIEKAAIEDGILTQARKNAEMYFSLLFRDLGYPEVIFVDTRQE